MVDSRCIFKREILAKTSVLLVFMMFVCNSYADSLFDFQMKLAKKGNKEAQFKVGELYESGAGVSQSTSDAVDWITKAAKQGHKTASLKLIYWDIEKNGVTLKNKSKIGNIEKAAKNNNEYAQYYLGKMFQKGLGVKKNLKTSLNWYDKAAFTGLLNAEKSAIEVLTIIDKQERIRKQNAKRSRLAKAKLAKENAAKKSKNAEKESRLKGVAEQTRAEDANAPSAYEDDDEDEEAGGSVASSPAATETLAQRKARYKALLKARKKRAAARDKDFGSNP